MANTQTKTSYKAPGSLGLFLGLGLFLMLIWLMINLQIIFLPMILAFFLTAFLNPIAQTFNRRGLPRSISVILTLALGLGIIWLMINFVTQSLASFQTGFPAYKGRLDLIVSQLSEFRIRRFNFLTLEVLKTQLSNLSFSGLVKSLFNSVFAMTGYFFLTIMFLLYFLPALPILPIKLKKAFPGHRGEELCRAMENISGQVQIYIVTKGLVSAALGLILGLICLAFGVDFASTWGIFAFFFNFIPTIGAILAAILPTLLCALQYNWHLALWLLLALGALLIFFGNFLEPLILGRSVNLSPVSALLAILFWGWLWGGIGMIIAVPATAVIKFSCDQFPSLKPVGVLLGNLPSVNQKLNQ